MWPNLQKTADLVTFTEEILNGKLYILCSDLWMNSLKFYATYFYCMPSWGLSQLPKLSCRQLAFTSSKGFLKNKKRPGTSFPVSFTEWFLKKNIPFVIFYYLSNFHCLVVFTSWDITQYVYCNCLVTRFWRHKFWNYTYLSNQAIFSTWPISQD